MRCHPPYRDRLGSCCLTGRPACRIFLLSTNENPSNADALVVHKRERRIIDIVRNFLSFSASFVTGPKPYVLTYVSYQKAIPPRAHSWDGRRLTPLRLASAL
jgi:hypothetical protein